MLRLMEIVLLAAILAIVLGLVVAGPKAPPVEEDPMGARERDAGKAERKDKAS